MYHAAHPRDNYDRIAHLYDVDMARNMPFDDIGLYVDQAARNGGRVLESGCGNGRVLVALLERGIDAVGIDCSTGMLDELRRKARERHVESPVCLMDVRRLGFKEAFGTVLCPYSLITYMSGAGDRERMLDGIFRALVPEGLVVVDAFIPRANAFRPQFTLDYRRALGEVFLMRSKRVVAVAPGINRVERRYEVTTADGAVMQRIYTRVDVRPLSPDDLVSVLEERGFEIEREWWDYGARNSPEGAQFYTVSARRPAAPRS
jgi:ubiquinone/menaquinone biosynthesis C-methylase UbiE